MKFAIFALLAAAAFARNIPEVCQEYETEVIKFGNTVVGDYTEALQAHHDGIAKDVDGPYNTQWSDPNWPGQGNPKAPPVGRTESPARKEELVTPREMGGLAPNPQAAASASFVEFSSFIQEDGSLVKIEPFVPENQALGYQGLAYEAKAEDAMHKTEAATAARNVAATHFLHKQIAANGAFGVLKTARDACVDGAFRSTRKGSMTCAETCDMSHPPAVVSNPNYAACVKGCVGYLEHEKTKNYDKFFLDQAGAQRKGVDSTSASNGNSLPRDIPTDEKETDDRFDQHP